MDKKNKFIISFVGIILIIFLGLYFYENYQIKKLNSEYYNNCLRQSIVYEEDKIPAGMKECNDLGGCYKECAGNCGIYEFADKPHMAISDVFKKYFTPSVCHDGCVTKCILPPN